MSIIRRPSLKAIGRKKVCFHLDQLVYLDDTADGYEWTCHMIEAGAYHYGTGVMCSESGVGFETQFECEEAALTHIQEMHQAMGGQRRPKNRGQARRERKIAEWNARHAKPRTTLSAVPTGEDEYFD